QVVRIRIGARIHGHRAGPTDAAAALADAVIGPDVGGHARTGGVAVDVAGDALSGIVVRRFDDLEVVQRILHQDLVIAVRRRRDTGPDVERDLLLPGPALLRLDDDDAVRRARSVDRRRRAVFQDLHRGDVVGVQEVEVRLLNGGPVNDVQ